MKDKTEIHRVDGRGNQDVRLVEFLPDFTAYPEGSILIKQGNTHVLCNVTIEEGVPVWMQHGGIEGGWITAEYAMLPRSTHQRNPRETSRPRSRSQEIRRLVGRSLRAGFYLDKLPAITCIVDCDVLQADGGTRTAAITGGYVALIRAFQSALPSDSSLSSIMRSPIAAISVGLKDGKILLDLDYEEDAKADADLNVVMNADLEIIEVQGTAERGSIRREEFDKMLDLSQEGIRQLVSNQARCIESFDA